jgi:hypothetical protein
MLLFAASVRVCGCCCTVHMVAPRCRQCLLAPAAGNVCVAASGCATETALVRTCQLLCMHRLGNVKRFHHSGSFGGSYTASTHHQLTSKLCCLSSHTSSHCQHGAWLLVVLWVDDAGELDVLRSGSPGQMQDSKAAEQAVM